MSRIIEVRNDRDYGHNILTASGNVFYIDTILVDSVILPYYETLITLLNGKSMGTDIVRVFRNKVEAYEYHDYMCHHMEEVEV